MRGKAAGVIFAGRNIAEEMRCNSEGGSDNPLETDTPPPQGCEHCHPTGKKCVIKGELIYTLICNILHRPENGNF